MRRAIFALLLLLGGCGAAQQASQSSQPPSGTAEERHYPNGLTPVEVFDLRTKCMKLVDEGSKDLSWGLVGNALINSTYPHYNPDTNHCYVETVATKNPFYAPSDIPNNYRTAAVYDAQTRQMLVVTDQEGARQSAQDDRPTATSLIVTYDQGEALIKQLMQEDAQ